MRVCTSWRGVGSGRTMNKAEARRLASDELGGSETWLRPGVCKYSWGDMVCVLDTISCSVRD
jgi:hypothetical protein